MMLHERLDAISASRVDGPSKLLLIMLAKRLDRDDPNGVVWSSSETLAEECGVSARAICHTMKRLTAAGIIRIVTKAAQGRCARKAIDWTALASAERDTTAIENIPAEKRRRVRSRSDEPSDLEVTDSQTLALRGVTPRGDAASEDPINDPSMNQIPESDPGTRSADVREPDAEPNEEHTVVDEPPNESDPMPTNHHGSRPTMDADPIDNDGATTHPPKAAAPSLPSIPTSIPTSHTNEVSDVPIPDDRARSVHGLHADGGGDVRRSGDGLAPQRAAEDRRAGQPVEPGQHVREPGAVSGRPEASGVEEGGPRRAAGDAPTLSPAPATSETSASIATESGSLPLAFDAPPPAKPKRKAKPTGPTEAQAEAWATCAQHWQTISGTVPRLSPTEGAGLSLTEAIARDGVAVVVRRFAYLAAGAGSWMRDRGAKITAVCRSAKSEWVVKTDREALDWERDRTASEALGASVGTLTHPSAQNAQERQPAPKQPVSWPDVLRDLGSDPDHHPDDGPLREHWPKVRQAIYTATKSAGDAWLTYCNADDRVRVHVQRLLSIRVAA